MPDEEGWGDDERLADSDAENIFDDGASNGVPEDDRPVVDDPSEYVLDDDTYEE